MFFLTWPAIPELNGYRVSSRSAGKNKSEPFAFREEAGEEGNSGKEQKQDSNGRRHFCRKASGGLPKSRQSNLGSWTLWQRSSNSMSRKCGGERAAERERGGGGGIKISRVFDRLLLPRISATAFRIPVRLCHYFHPSKFYHFLSLEP
jgi:hypothetical protein